MTKTAIGPIADDLKIASESFKQSSGKDRACTVIAIDQHPNPLLTNGLHIDRC
jgi:hypothetical protein